MAGERLVARLPQYGRLYMGVMTSMIRRGGGHGRKMQDHRRGRNPCAAVLGSSPAIPISVGLLKIPSLIDLPPDSNTRHTNPPPAFSRPRMQMRTSTRIARVLTGAGIPAFEDSPHACTLQFLNTLSCEQTCMNDAYFNTALYMLVWV